MLDGMCKIVHCHSFQAQWFLDHDLQCLEFLLYRNQMLHSIISVCCQPWFQWSTRSDTSEWDPVLILLYVVLSTCKDWWIHDYESQTKVYRGGLESRKGLRVWNYGSRKRRLQKWWQLQVQLGDYLTFSSLMMNLCVQTLVKVFISLLLLFIA